MFKVIKRKKYETYLQTNHLIQDYEQKDYQLKMYLDNWVNYLNIDSEIWLSHNWSGRYDEKNASRYNKYKTRTKRSCGRPLANVIEIRAGGLGKSRGAVVPCPNVLGHDSIAVMGHVENNKLLDVINNDKFQDLRKHVEGDFDSIDFCKNCDHLLDVPESLVGPILIEENMVGAEFHLLNMSVQLKTINNVSILELIKNFNFRDTKTQN